MHHGKYGGSTYLMKVHHGKHGGSTYLMKVQHGKHGGSTYLIASCKGCLWCHQWMDCILCGCILRLGNTWSLSPEVFSSIANNELQHTSHSTTGSVQHTLTILPLVLYSTHFPFYHLFCSAHTQHSTTRSVQHPLTILPLVPHPLKTIT